MSHQEVKNYIIHLPEFQIVIYRFYEIDVPSKNPLRHYEQNYTSKKDYPVTMEIRRKIAEYMATFDLLESDKIVSILIIGYLKSRVVLRHPADADLNLIHGCSSIPGFIRFFKSTYFCVSRLTHYIWRSARIRIWVSEPQDYTLTIIIST
jgi:hypothetical protein